MTYRDDDQRTTAYSQQNPRYPDQYPNDAYSGPSPVSEPITSGDAAVTRFDQALSQIEDLEAQNRSLGAEVKQLKPFRPIAVIAGAAAVLFAIIVAVLLLRGTDDEPAPAEGPTATVTQTEQAEPPEPTTVTQTETEKPDPTTVTKTETSVETTTETKTVSPSQAGGADE